MEFLQILHSRICAAAWLSGGSLVAGGVGRGWAAGTGGGGGGGGGCLVGAARIRASATSFSRSPSS